MPPDSVVIVLQMVGSRDYYVSMAHGCGHYGMPFFSECKPNPLKGSEYVRYSARSCKEITDCVGLINTQCSLIIDLLAFVPVFVAAFSYAFNMFLAESEWA